MEGSEPTQDTFSALEQSTFFDLFVSDTNRQWRLSSNIEDSLPTFDDWRGQGYEGLRWIISDFFLSKKKNLSQALKIGAKCDWRLELSVADDEIERFALFSALTKNVSYFGSEWVYHMIHSINRPD